MSKDNNAIVIELKKKLDPVNIKVRPDSGMAYIEGWHAEAEANKIFNFEWNSEILSMIENTTPTKNQKDNNVVSFRAIVRVTTPLGFKDGCGYGSGINRDIHAAYEGAIKEAETDAEKRALKKYGNRFGLALYDKTKANVGVDIPPENTVIKLKNKVKTFSDSNLLLDWERLDPVVKARAELPVDLGKEFDEYVKDKHLSFTTSPSGL